jgi:hypothetical protein
MTTVTIITGDPMSGRKLVGAALASYIRQTQNKRTYAVSPGSKIKPDYFNANLDDLLLVSSSDKLEPWMKPWIARYGQPLFTIHITRHNGSMPHDTERI